MLLYLQLGRESYSMAWQSLVQNKLRTFLSMLGIAMGIFCIVAVNAVVGSMKASVNESFESFGKGVIYIQKWPFIFSDNYPWWKYVNRPDPTPREVTQLKEKLAGNPLVKEVAFMTQTWGKSVKYEGQVAERVTGMAVSHEYKDVNPLDLALGRYFTYFESRQGAQVIVLGHTLATTLFSDEDPIGKQVVFMGRKMTIIGVLQKKGKGIMGPSEDEWVIFPLQFFNKLMNAAQFNRPSLLVKGADNIEETELEYAILGAMRSIRRLKPEQDANFALNKITMITGAINSVFAVLQMAGFVIGLFAILVGGFGIANIMFVSVKERTNLIGIQKALGAKRAFILFQFLTEAVVLAVFGGLIGMGFVFIGTLIAQVAMDFDVTLSLSNFVFGNVLSTAIGIIAGLIPAYGASRLDPVEAIRSKG